MKLKKLETRTFKDHTITLSKARSIFSGHVFHVDWKKLEAPIMALWFPTQYQAHRFIRDTVKGVQNVKESPKATN